MGSKASEKNAARIGETTVYTERNEDTTIFNKKMGEMGGYVC